MLQPGVHNGTLPQVFLFVFPAQESEKTTETLHIETDLSEMHDFRKQRQKTAFPLSFFNKLIYEVVIYHTKSSRVDGSYEV